MKYFLSAIFVTLILASCFTKKKIVEESIKEESSSLLIDTYKENILSFNTAELIANMEFDSPQMTIGFNGVFRMKNEELIWGSFKKFGFEAARVQITPDSIWILNRFQKEVYIEALDGIQKVIGIPLKFQDLEQLILGGSFLTDKVVMLNDSTLSQVQAVNGDMVEAIHIFNKNFDIKSSSVVAQNQGDILIEYDNHRIINDKKIAFNRDIMAQNANTAVTLGIQTQNIDIDPSFETPFAIPSNYTRKSF